jgi:hypothetical protein
LSGPRLILLGTVALALACRVPDEDARPGAVAAPTHAVAAAEGNHGTPRGEAVRGHLTLTGDYRVDRAALVTCALFPNRSFQVAFTTPEAPYVFLYFKTFQGAGSYDAEARVRANYSGESMRVSRGPTRAEIRVVPAPGNSDLISGSFQGEYKGEGGKGTVAGTFESCRYQGLRH